MTDAKPSAPVTILVAEDDPTIRMMMATTLRIEGYVVLDAPDGTTAETLAGKYRVPLNLLVTDYVMPDMNGAQLADSLRARFPGLKVLLVSAHIEEEPVQKGIMQEAFKKGASFLQKPFSPEELTRKVRAVLQGL